MSQDEAKAIYDAMLESGDLEMLLPNANGNWEEDRELFMAIHNANKELLDDDIFDI